MNFLWTHTNDNKAYETKADCVVVEGHLHGSLNSDKGDVDITFNVDIDPQFKDLLSK